MNSIKNLSISMLTLVLLAGTSVSPVKASREDVSDALMIGAAGAAVVAGGFLAGSWLFSSSDNDIIKGAYAAHKEAAAFSCVCDNVQREKQRLETEDVLAGVAQKGMKNMTVYLADMQKAIDRVNKNISAVAKRMKKKNDSSKICQEMRDISRLLEDDYDALRATHRYLRNHTAYFALYEAEQSIMQYYGHILEAAERYVLGSQGAESFARELRAAIMHNSDRAAYPYLDFVERLTNKKQHLDACINRLGSGYPELLNICNALSNNLALIKREVMAQKDYSDALRDRERDRIERERIQAQRELQAQNQMLIAQLAYEQSKPTYVVEYVQQKPSYVYVKPQPAVSVEYEVSYEVGADEYVVEYEV